MVSDQWSVVREHGPRVLVRVAGTVTLPAHYLGSPHRCLSRQVPLFTGLFCIATRTRIARKWYENGVSSVIVQTSQSHLGFGARHSHNRALSLHRLFPRLSRIERHQGPLPEDT